MTVFKFLYPGIKIKRWILIAFIGIVLVAMSISAVINSNIPGLTEKLAKALPLQITGRKSYIPIGFLYGLPGLILIIVGFRQMIINMMTAITPDKEEKLLEIIYSKHHLKKGPKIVVLGGGTGLSVLLRGLKQYTSNITAIVAVTDDGGNSGQLRNELGMLPPGDIRNCLVALADKETLMEQLLQFRFENGNSLSGHNMGNLFLAAMNEITGQFDLAIKEMSKVLAIRGQVIPATLENAVLCAELEDGTVIEGESSIPLSERKIKRVFLNPEKCSPVQESLEAIRDADAIVIGPGSLFTSIMPNLLVKGIPEAIRNSKAIKIFACNIMTQPGETDDYTASMHIRKVIEHAGRGLIDYAVVNVEHIPRKLQKKYWEEGATAVIPDARAIEKMGIRVAKERLVYESDVVRHDPVKLSKAIMSLIFRNNNYEKNNLIDFYRLGEKFRSMGNNDRNFKA